MHTAFLRSIIIFSFMALILACNNNRTSSQHSGALRFNLPEGKAYRYDMDFRTEQDANGNPLLSEMKTSYIIEVVDDSAGFRKVKNTYERFVVKMKGANNSMTDIDTERPVQNPDSASVNSMGMMSSMFKTLKGKSFYMLVDREGQVVKIEGLQELMQSVVESLDVPEETKNMIRPVLASMFSEETVKQTFSQSFNIYPNRVVKVGDSWEKETVGNSMMQLSGKTTYTVKDISNDKVTVEAVARLGTAGSTTDLHATYVLDAPTGLILNADFRSTFGSPVTVTTTGTIKGGEVGDKR